MKFVSGIKRCINLDHIRNEEIREELETLNTKNACRTKNGKVVGKNI